MTFQQLRTQIGQEAKTEDIEALKNELKSVKEELREAKESSEDAQKKLKQVTIAFENYRRQAERQGTTKSNGSRPIIVHFHIFKNAGTTIDWILQKNFGRDAVEFDDKVKASNIYPPEKIVNVAKEHPTAKSLSSHQIRFPLPQSRDYNFISIVCIRHPIDRAVSIYSFTKTEPRNDPYHILAKKSDLKRFVEVNIQTKEYNQLKNPQTRWLAQEIKEFNPPVRLAKAIENITFSSVLGVVDRLDESLVVAEQALKSHFPNIDMSYVSQNVTTGRAESLQDRLKQTREEIGENLMSELVKRNDLDMEVYSQANRELDNRISKVVGFQEKLISFRRRCAMLVK